MQLTEKKHTKLLEVLKTCSKQWREEIEDRRRDREFDPDYMADNDNDAGDDAAIFLQIMGEIEGNDIKLYKAGRIYLIDAGVYRAMTDHEIKNTIVTSGKIYAFKLNGVKYTYAGNDDTIYLSGIDWSNRHGS